MGRGWWNIHDGMNCSGTMEAGVLMDIVDGRCLNCLTIVVYMYML